jgi:hypothetical protein
LFALPQPNTLLLELRGNKPGPKFTIPDHCCPN